MISVLCRHHHHLTYHTSIYSDSSASISSCLDDLRLVPLDPDCTGGRNGKGDGKVGCAWGCAGNGRPALVNTLSGILTTG